QALSAGIEVGYAINDRAAAMLGAWGVDAGGHRPRPLNRALCERADAIFLMGPEYLRRLLDTYGSDLATKAYLFADPFRRPHSFPHGEYLVYGPSFADCPVAELVGEFAWFRERIVQIHQALRGGDPALVPAAHYLDVLQQ